MFRVGCLSWGAEPIKEAGERLPDFMGVARHRGLPWDSRPSASKRSSGLWGAR